MPSKNHTTVVLNEFVQKYKDELAPIYGLKNILEAGLLLFSRLSDSEQKKTVAEVNRMAQADKRAGGIVSRAASDAAKQKRKGHRKPSKAG